MPTTDTLLAAVDVILQPCKVPELTDFEHSALEALVRAYGGKGIAKLATLMALDQADEAVTANPEGWREVDGVQLPSITWAEDAAVTKLNAQLSPNDELLELASWIEEQRSAFEHSIARDDPVLKKHQAWLKSKEDAIRRGAAKLNAQLDVVVANAKEPR